MNLIEELLQATRQERQRIEEPKNRSRYFVFGKRKQEESLKNGVYTVVFENAPERVIRDAERSGTAMFKIGDKFVEGTMGLGSGDNIFVTIPESFFKTNDIDLEAMKQSTESGIEYVMDNRELLEFSIAFIEKYGHTANPILKNLVGKTKKTASVSPVQHTVSLTELNDSQRCAVHKALRQRVTFVWGPPGTGKTKTLGALTASLVNSGKRVLLCALSNNAVDQLLLSAIKCIDLKATGIARMGPYMDKQLLPFSKDAFLKGKFGSKKVGVGWNDHLQRASVIAANFTYLTLPRLPWLGKIDYVIADEVSMASIPSLAIASFFASTAMVLGGDPYQLPPIFPEDAEEPNKWFKQNIFHHAGIVETSDDDVRVAYDDVRVVFLDTQYRMHPRIGDLISVTFYGSMLKNGTNKNRFEAARTTWHEKNVWFLHTRGIVEYAAGTIGGKDNHKRINDTHAKLIARVVVDLMKQKVSTKDIGVIAPYNAQVANISKHLKDQRIPGDLKVSTVHSFQGQERPIVIVDFTDDNCEPTPLTAKKELVNVALSRAKEVLILVGNRDYLQNPAYFSPEEVECFKNIISSSYLVEL